MADEPARSPIQRYGGYAVLAIVAVAVAAAAVWLFVSGADDEATPVAQRPDVGAGLIGRPAPAFSLVDARNPEAVVSLSDFLGKPVVLNWYTTDCPRCETEIPVLHGVQEDLDGQVVVLGINIGAAGTDGAGFLDDLDVTYAALADPDRITTELYELTDAPTTYFIDAEGFVIDATGDPFDRSALIDQMGKLGIAFGLIDSHRPEVGESAPDFALTDARDRSHVVRLSDFRGTPVVLNWYATWCGPCRSEIPDFQAAFETLDGKVVFLGVNLQESAGEAVGLLDDLEATYPALLDAEGAVAEHYRLLGMPTTYFIDAEGIVVAFGTGRIIEETLAQELGKLGFVYEPPED